MREKYSPFFSYFASLGLGAFREAARKRVLSLAGRSNPDRLHPVQSRRSHGVLTASCFLILLSGISLIVIKRAVTHKMGGPKPALMGGSFPRNNSVTTSIKIPVISIFICGDNSYKHWCAAFRQQCLFIQYRQQRFQKLTSCTSKRLQTILIRCLILWLTLFCFLELHPYCFLQFSETHNAITTLTPNRRSRSTSRRWTEVSSVTSSEAYGRLGKRASPARQVLHKSRPTSL